MSAHRMEQRFSTKLILLSGFGVSAVLFGAIVDRSALIYIISFCGIAYLYNLTEPNKVFAVLGLLASVACLIGVTLMNKKHAQQIGRPL